MQHRKTLAAMFAALVLALALPGLASAHFQMIYTPEIALDKGGEIIGYQFVNLGKMMDAIKKGEDPKAAYEKNLGTYGRFAEADRHLGVAMANARKAPWPEGRLMLLVARVVRVHSASRLRPPTPDPPNPIQKDSLSNRSIRRMPILSSASARWSSATKPSKSNVRFSALRANSVPARWPDLRNSRSASASPNSRESTSSIVNCISR